MRDYTKPPHERPLYYETAMEIRFEEWADRVRRYAWAGGIEDADEL